MQTHPERDHVRRPPRDHEDVDVANLEARYQELEDLGQIPGETEAVSHVKDGVQITRMEADESGCLRVSVGGGRSKDHGEVCYLVYRGDKAACLKILKKAIRALAT